jgi:Uma2 family endonuclease
VPASEAITVEAFDRLHRSGALADPQRLELIDGAICEQRPSTARRAYARTQLFFRLHDALVRIQSPGTAMIRATVAMPPHNAPDPDIVVTTEPKGEGYVPVDCVMLLIDVTDTDAARLRVGRSFLFAAHQVSEYWVVDLPDRMLHQLWQPSPAGYRQGRSVPLEGTIESITIVGLQVDGVGLI